MLWAASGKKARGHARPCRPEHGDRAHKGRRLRRLPKPAEERCVRERQRAPQHVSRTAARACPAPLLAKSLTYVVQCSAGGRVCARSGASLARKVTRAAQLPVSRCKWPPPPLAEWHLSAAICISRVLAARPYLFRPLRRQRATRTATGRRAAWRGAP